MPRLIIFGALLLSSFSTLWANALDDYVAHEDSSYQWSLELCREHDTYWYCVLSMTSQTWRSPQELSPASWHHWITLVIPKGHLASTATLFVGGGHSDTPYLQNPPQEHIEWALSTRSVFARVSCIPNTPIHFLDDTDPKFQSEGRYEDDIIAYTWLKYFQTHDPSWPLRMPMTKAVIRAMDTLQAFCQSFSKQPLLIEDFAVMGRSKRGWTAWTAAAVDKRVVAILPVVIDVLNVRACILHQYNSLGYWYPSLRPYTALGLEEFVMTKAFDAMMALEDPYSYKERLTQPKYIINASGDRFFLPDSSQFYFHDLPGTKYLRYIPNADHDLNGTNYFETARLFFNAIAHKKALPSFSWHLTQNGTLSVITPTPPLTVRLWHANNPTARDFRILAIGKAFTSTILHPTAPNTYLVTPPTPSKGWTAYFVELTFDSGDTTPYTFTTDVFITPNTTPFHL